MRGKCPSCRNEQELIEETPRVLLHALTQLNYPVEIKIPINCTNCGREVQSKIYFAKGNKCVSPSQYMQSQTTPKQHLGHVFGHHGKFSTSLSYVGILTPNQDVLFPAHEGNLQTGHAIDRFGDPDLMVEFSVEYLKQYWAIVPKGRLPHTISEMMPALNLLVNAAELALKAILIRAAKRSEGHSLPTLYENLDCRHREEMARRFAYSQLNSDLKSLGVGPVTIKSVLEVYGAKFSWSSVYLETRYFAEPTTKLKSNSLKGGNLVKGTPYPIFLPVAVQTMIDVYEHFSGAERLKRLGAEVGYGSRDLGNDQHGDWSLIPSSIDLVVVRVAQFAVKDECGNFRNEFLIFKKRHPPGYCTSWMYGGNTLLFYRADKLHPNDGETVIDGLECKVWFNGRLGMHARDLYLLADAIESPREFNYFRGVRH